MGCCEGKLPNADDFLAAQSPRPVGPFLACISGCMFEKEFEEFPRCLSKGEIL